MNRYQNKRVIGCLKRKLTDPERIFLESIKDLEVVAWPEPHKDELSEAQNHVLNKLAQKVGG